MPCCRRAYRLGGDTSEWEEVSRPAAEAPTDRAEVSEQMGKGALLGLTSLSFEGAGAVLKEALDYDHGANVPLHPDHLWMSYHSHAHRHPCLNMPKQDRVKLLFRQSVFPLSSVDARMI